MHEYVYVVVVGCFSFRLFQCRASASDVSKWIKKEVVLEAKGSDHGARLQLTTTKKGSLWIDQVSAMPVDTYKVIDFKYLLQDC